MLRSSQRSCSSAGGAGGAPSILPGLDLPTADGLAGPPSWWGACTLGVLLLTQAYTGWTPGKRVVGIAVVDATTLRPIRLGRTLLRWLEHVLDAILLIGYLRPLWEARRRTFADGLLHSVVLETRSPDGDPTSGTAFARAITPAAACCARGPCCCRWASWVGGTRAPQVTLELTASSRDGSATRTVTATGEYLVLELPEGDLRNLGDDFTYRAVVVEGGADLIACEG